MLAGGRASAELRGLLEEGGPQRVVRRLSWLGVPEDARDFRRISWELDPYARGGYAAARDIEVMKLMDLSSSPA